MILKYCVRGVEEQYKEMRKTEMRILTKKKKKKKKRFHEE
jgi:hypothetical protein